MLNVVKSFPRLSVFVLLRLVSAAVIVNASCTCTRTTTLQVFVLLAAFSALLLPVCVCEIAFDYRASLHFITAAAALNSTLKTQAASTFKDGGY